MALKKRRKPRPFAFDAEDAVDQKPHHRGLPNCRMRTLMWWVSGRTARIARNRYEKPGTKRPMNVFFSYRVWLDRIFPYISSLRPLHQKTMSKFASACWQSCDSTAQLFWRSLQEPGQRRWESEHPDYRYKPRTKTQIETDRAKRKVETDELRRERYLQKRLAKEAGMRDGHSRDISEGGQTPGTVGTAEESRANSSTSPQDEERTAGTSRPAFDVVPRFRPRFQGMTAPLYKWLDDFPPLSYADAEDEAAQAAVAIQQLPAVNVTGVRLDSLGLSEPPSHELIMARMKLFKELGRDPTGTPLHPSAYPSPSDTQSLEEASFPSRICELADACKVDLAVAVSGSLPGFPRPVVMVKPPPHGSSPSSAHLLLTPISSSPAHSVGDSIQPSSDANVSTPPLTLKRKRTDSDASEDALARTLRKKIRTNVDLLQRLPPGQTDVFWDETSPDPDVPTPQDMGKGKEREPTPAFPETTRGVPVGTEKGHEDDDNSDWATDDEEDDYRKLRAEVQAKWEHHWAHDFGEKTGDDITSHRCDYSLPADRFSDFQEVTEEELDQLEAQFIQAQNVISQAADAELQQKKKAPRKGKTKAVGDEGTLPPPKTIPARKVHRELQQTAIIQQIQTAARVSQRTFEIQASLDAAEPYRNPRSKSSKAKTPRDPGQTSRSGNSSERAPIARANRRSASPTSGLRDEERRRAPTRVSTRDMPHFVVNTRAAASTSTSSVTPAYAVPPDSPPNSALSTVAWPPSIGFWYWETPLFYSSGSPMFTTNGEAAFLEDDLATLSAIDELAPMPDETPAATSSAVSVHEEQPSSLSSLSAATDLASTHYDTGPPAEGWREEPLVNDALREGDVFSSLPGFQGTSVTRDELLAVVLREEGEVQGVLSPFDALRGIVSSEPPSSAGAGPSQPAPWRTGIRRVTREFLGIDVPDEDLLLSLQLDLLPDADLYSNLDSNLTTPTHLPTPVHPIPNIDESLDQQKQPIQFPSFNAYSEYTDPGPSRHLHHNHNSASMSTASTSISSSNATEFPRARLPFDPIIHDPRSPVEPVSRSRANTFEDYDTTPFSHAPHIIQHLDQPADAFHNDAISSPDTSGYPDSAVLAASSLLSLRSGALPAHLGVSGSPSTPSPRRFAQTWRPSDSSAGGPPS